MSIEYFHDLISIFIHHFSLILFVIVYFLLYNFDKIMSIEYFHDLISIFVHFINL